MTEMNITKENFEAEGLHKLLQHGAYLLSYILTVQHLAALPAVAVLFGYIFTRNNLLPLLDLLLNIAGYLNSTDARCADNRPDEYRTGHD